MSHAELLKERHGGRLFALSYTKDNHETASCFPCFRYIV